MAATKCSVLAALAPWFAYEREVCGTHCTGRRLRVDAVLRPRESAGWKDAEPAFGVEFKLAGTKPFNDTKDFTHWAAQAADYAHVKWDRYGYLRTFTCPSATRYLVTDTPAPLADPARLISRLLWEFGVGELAQLDRHGWTLLGQGDHILWSETHGVHEARRWSLTPKIGSR